MTTAIQQWMGWSIGRQTSKDYGIPRGLPYLTGFVIHCEIAEESLAPEASVAGNQVPFWPLRV